MKYSTPRIFITLFAFVILCSGCVDKKDKNFNVNKKGDSKAAALFNGYDFNGWDVDTSLFWIEDSSIVAGNLDSPNEYMVWVTTQKEFGDFILEADVKLIGDEVESPEGDEIETPNGGIYFRCHYTDENVLAGYETDMWTNVEEADSLWWGSLHDPFGPRDFDEFNILGNQDSLRKVFNKNDWNHVKIYCKGPKIKVWFNGLLTADFTEYDESASPAGIIGLQLHSGPPMRVWYKNVYLQEL
jgi:hypothetical protein